MEHDSRSRCTRYLRPDCVHVPGPDEDMGAPCQLGREAPDALPADEHHAEGPRAHGCVQRQVQPGGGCLCRRAEVGGACSSSNEQQMMVKLAGENHHVVAVMRAADRGAQRETELVHGGGTRRLGHRKTQNHLPCCCLGSSKVVWLKPCSPQPTWRGGTQGQRWIWQGRDGHDGGVRV